MEKITKERPHYINLLSAIFYCLLIATSFSCKKFIQIPSPATQLVTSSVYNNNGTATSTVTGIYTQMYNNEESWNISHFNGELSDELASYASSSDAFYLNFTNASVSGTYGEWNNAYKYIFEANSTINGLQQYTGTSPAVKQQLLGESYFIRAFWQFYLSNCYGAVPIVLTTDYTITSKLSRSTRLQVLQQVISDLKTAESLLSSNYVDASDTTSTTQRSRPNKAAAAALLARAYLYLGDYNGKDINSYSAAEDVATSIITGSVINNPSEYSLCSNLSGVNSVFLANSTEAIWQLYTPLPSNYDTWDGYFFVLIAAPKTNSLYSLSPQLLNAFESGDKRSTNWISSITIGGVAYYFPYKYKNRNYTGNEYTMVLRLAEQYLIRAEARVEKGEIAAAISDLNAIRNRAGLPNYNGAIDQSSLLDAIQHERQVELFSEWGHRWFDLNRALNTAATTNINTVLGTPGNIAQYKGGVWSSDGHQRLYPIPQSEINIDHNLTQNPGY